MPCCDVSQDRGGQRTAKVYDGGMSETEMESFTVRVAKPVAKRLRALAKRELSSLNREVNIAIRSHLDAEERRVRR